MATGFMNLSISAAVPPDGSSGNAAPAISRVQGTEANPKKHSIVAAFDPATDEHLWWTFAMPGDYASGGALDVLWESNDTGASETCVWGARVGAVTEGDADTPVEHAQAAAATASEDVNTTEARRLISTTVTLTMDSAAAGDLITLALYRDADAAGDDLSSDATVWAARFSYTTA